MDDLKKLNNGNYIIEGITPKDGSYIHRFYDTSPISPSGKYIAVCRLPYENKTPIFGEKATVVVIEVATKNVVYNSETFAWDTQLGAQVQWGTTDNELYFNRLDINDFNIFGVKVNIFDNVEFKLQHAVYMVSPNGDKTISPCLNKISNVQKGYGVILPSEKQEVNRGAEKDDGLFIIDNNTGEKSLLLSFSSIYEQLKDIFFDIDLNKGAFYGFHVKWNPQASKIMFLIRWLPDNTKKTKNFLITMNDKGKELNLAVGAKRWVGGHHPNWCPDGEHIVMNLMFKNEKSILGRVDTFLEKVARKFKVKYFSDENFLRFSLIHYTGSSIEIYNCSTFGSGHPSFHPTESFLVSDCYPNERVSLKGGLVPIRLITNSQEQNIAVLNTTPQFYGKSSEFRIDPHPAWSNSGDSLVINALNGDKRGVFVIKSGRELQ